MIENAVLLQITPRRQLKATTNDDFVCASDAGQAFDDGPTVLAALSLDSGSILTS